MPGTEQGGVVDGLGGKESMKTVRKDVQRDGGMQRCPEYVLRCPEYAMKDVSGSAESVSGFDDLCPGEGGNGDKGGAADGEGKIEGGDDNKSRNLDSVGRGRRSELKLQSKIQIC